METPAPETKRTDDTKKIRQSYSETRLMLLNSTKPNSHYLDQVRTRIGNSLDQMTTDMRNLYCHLDNYKD